MNTIELTPNLPPPPQPMRLAYSLREVAEMLGCHRSTIERLVRAGKLRAIRVGDLKVTHDEIQRFLNSPSE